MRKKKTSTSARRGPGRPRKTTTSDQPKAAKRRPGRPKKKVSAAKKVAKRVGKAAMSIASAATDTLFGKVRGLARWVPEKGDMLITKTAGAFQLGKSSWRRTTVPSGSLTPDTSGPKTKAVPAAASTEEPVKRRRGRPRKIRVDESEQVVPIKGYRKRRNIEEAVLDEVDDLTSALKGVVRGSVEKKAQ